MSTRHRMRGDTCHNSYFPEPINDLTLNIARRECDDKNDID